MPKSVLEKSNEETQKEFLKGILDPENQKEFLKSIINPKKKDKRKIAVDFCNNESNEPKDYSIVKIKNQSVEKSPFAKSLYEAVGYPKETIQRLAFEVNPDVSNQFDALWIRKPSQLLPDEILKRISIQDDLIACICSLRGNQLSAFGRPQPDRFSTGYKIEPEPGYMEKVDKKEKGKIQKQIKDAEAKLLTCGSVKRWKDYDQMGFGQFLAVQARNAIVFNRIAIEVVQVWGPEGKEFHSFRPIDVGTIYKAKCFTNEAKRVREEALKLLRRMKNKKENSNQIDPNRYVDNEFDWIQVINGYPQQAFTSEECLVYQFHPTTDIELEGYPVTALDSIISAVTTHLNITTHNKLYFQSGRASKGAFVIQSDDVDQSIVSQIRQNMQANINSVNNAWRTPVIGVGSADEVKWLAMDSGNRDMEFQYLSDDNARKILAAFQMSPEEVPGYSHLGRGTNSQALSESNQEFKLLAHRDVGIRPLLAHFQNFINAKILPLIAPELKDFCHFKFIGLDADTAEKESVRLHEDMNVHMTVDEILEQVKKKPIGKKFGGKFLLNPQWQAQIDKYVMVGDIMEQFFGIEGASKDPRFQYVRDPFFFNWLQFQQQKEQLSQQQGAAIPQITDLSTGVDQLAALLSKSEKDLPPAKRGLLEYQRKTIQHALEGFEKDSESVLNEILEVAENHLPNGLKE